MAQVKGITTSESGSAERENRRAAVEAHKASGGNTARANANAKAPVNAQSSLERAQPGLHKNNVGGYTLVKDASARTAGEQRTHELMQQREHEISRYNEMATYFNSGATDYDSTSRYLQEARDFANNSKDEPRKNAWLEMANAMETQSWADNSKRKADTQAQIDALEQQAKQTHNEMVSAATSIAMLGFDLNGEATKTHDELAKQLAGIKQQQNQLQALLDSYGQNTNAELDELQARLTKATDARATWKVYKELGAKNQHEAGYMKQQDQIRADELNAMMANPQQYYNLNDRMAGLIGSKETGLVGSALNIGAWSLEGLLHDNEQTREAQLEYDNAARAFLATGDPKYQEEMAAAEAKLAAAQQAIANGEAERNSAVTKVEQWADTFDTASQTEIQKAKEGLNKYGQFGMDMASTALDIGFDALTGAPLASMFGRVLGSSIGEARRAGATHGQQAAYGLTKASIELVTEKISDGLGVVYGKGVSTDIVEAAIEKLAKSEAGANLLRGIAGALGEGTEEVISDLLDPFTQWIINEDARDNHVYELDQSELLRDFLLGAAMGLMGQGVEVAQGGYAEKNAEIAKNDQATIEAAENAEATGQQLSERDLHKLELAESRLAPKGSRGIKGALDVDEKGRVIVHSGEGENRHQKAVNVQVEGAQQLGYGKDVNVDEAYDTATSGAEERLPTADGAAGTEYGYDPTQDEPPPENTKGGDARVDEESALNEEEIKEKTKQAYEADKARVASAIDDIIQNSEKDNRGNVLIKATPTSRDPEFIAKNEKLESMVGNMLESGEDARAITQYTLRQMKAASKEMPIYAVKTKGKGVRKTIKYDGVTLTMITEGKDGKPKVVTIGPENVVKQAKYLQGTTGSNAYASITPEEYYQVDVPQRGLKIVDLAEEMFEMVGAGSDEFPTAETFSQKQAEMEAAVNAKDYRIYERIGLNPPGAYEAAMASETAQGEEQAPDQQTTPEEQPEPVKPQENKRQEAAETVADITASTKAQLSGPVTTTTQQNGTISSAELQAQQGTQETQETPSTPHTPGTVRESRSAFESTQATKGERTNAEENAEGPEGTFVSRTNADRTATANSLTDTQEKRDAQAKRLLESENWTDDDVVIAQKLMFDMLKGIRDYQLHLKRKMKLEAFKAMTQQYNSLLERHKKMLSEAGQKLQANYEFSNGEKILTRAAHTFLGFTEDGRFAGGNPNAKNARIYSAIEDASERIAKAVETGDRQSLAKICKDISDIRNVKKMFGPLGKFASEMESRNLSRLTTSENGLQMLENLAYGNLNAMCDDVQPYKHLNAVKTIRVMNMLSNMSTIVNNVANNWVQGVTGNNALAQTMTKIASKPFANLTGQEVYATAGRGKAVRQQVHNAKMEALEMATLAQMYGITYENGRLELNDRGMFNPNINVFEQTFSLYKFLIGMGVEATDQVQAAGIAKRMEAGLDREIAAGNISPQMKEQMMNEINHETSRLLYKDNNTFTSFVQTVRNFLNKIAHVGNEDIGTIGLGDITMAFAKIPANVVKTRLMMSPEGALYNVASYAKGVNKAKQMHAEVLAKSIAMDESLSDAAKWSRARQECSGRVYKKLTQIRDNYAQGLTFEHAVERAGYMQATEMSQFEMAQLSRKIGRAATSVGMVALGSILRGLGALRDFDQEPDDELKRMYREKGYSGLMINFNAIGRKGHEWKDGDTVIGGDFLEVIAMPLAIGAAAAESAGNAEGLNVDKYFKTVFSEGLEKAFTAVGDIPGMTDALNLYDSVSNSFANNDDIGGTLGSSALLYAANTLPSLFIPNAFSQAAAGLDNTMRDVYTSDNVWQQAWNTVKNKGGVLIRHTIPASVDVWGNERTYGENRFMGLVNKSLLPGDARIFHQSKYEKEVARLVKVGYKGAIPKTSVSGSFEVGNETYKLTADEKRGFKLGRNQAQAVAFETFMDSKWYQELNDDQRMKVFQALKTSAERDARQMVLNDRQLDVEVTRDKWESELGNINDQIQFLAAKQLAGYVWDRDEREVSDFAEMDNYLAITYDKLSDKQRELLNNSYSHLDDMNEARAKYGISSQMWQQAYDIYSDYNSDEGKARVEGGYKDWEQSEMWTKIANVTGATEKQMEFFTNNMKLYNHIAPQAEKYQTLVGSGWSRDSAQNLTKAMSDLKAINGNKTVSYKQRLTQIAKATDISEDQKWEAFFEYCPSSYTSIINKMVARRNRGVPYDKALKEIGKWME